MRSGDGVLEAAPTTSAEGSQSMNRRAPTWTLARTVLLLPVAPLLILAACVTKDVPIGQNSEALACSTDGDCPQGETCAADTCSSPSGCTTDADCPMGEQCNSGVCGVPVQPQCASDADCAMGEACIN